MTKRRTTWKKKIKVNFYHTHTHTFSSSTTPWSPVLVLTAASYFSPRGHSTEYFVCRLYVGLSWIAWQLELPGRESLKWISYCRWQTIPRQTHMEKTNLFPGSNFFLVFRFTCPVHQTERRNLANNLYFRLASDMDFHSFSNAVLKWRKWFCWVKLE